MSGKASLAYSYALKEAEKVDPPAVGFLTTHEVQGSTTVFRNLIKQNNTIIQLLTQIASETSEIIQDLRDLKKTEAEKPSSSSGGVPQDIIDKLDAFTISGTKWEKPKPNPGQFFAYKKVP